MKLNRRFMVGEITIPLCAPRSLPTALLFVLPVPTNAPGELAFVPQADTTRRRFSPQQLPLQKRRLFITAFDCTVCFDSRNILPRRTRLVFGVGSDAVISLSPRPVPRPSGVLAGPSRYSLSSASGPFAKFIPFCDFAPVAVRLPYSACSDALNPSCLASVRQSA